MCRIRLLLIASKTIHLVALVLVMTLPVSCKRSSAQRKKLDRPNVVLIMADDLGAGELGCYGRRDSQTPNIDALARTGLVFRTCWATPLCSPTRAQILTGRYGFHTGWYDLLDTEMAPDHFDPHEITFADTLKEHGYVSMLSGKWHLGGITRNPTMIHDSGFDEYCVWASHGLPPRSRYTGSLRDRYWQPAAVENGEFLPTRPEDYGPDLYADKLIDFMQRHAEGPFVAYHPMILPHDPYVPLPDIEQGSGKAGGDHAAYLQYMDRIVGRIVGALDELGIRDRTYVFFCGDNGPARRGKGLTIEVGVRVPMIVNGPGIKEPGRVSDAVIDMSDVCPTLVDLAGAALPEGLEIDGVSFAPILRGEATDTREWIFSYLRYERMLRDRRWLLQGDNRFFDCGDHRDGADGCAEVTQSQDPEVRQARRRFRAILNDLPAPERSPQPAAKKPWKTGAPARRR